MACEEFSCVFRELENAVNMAAITDFLMEKRFCNTIINYITLIACKYDIYKRRRIFGKMNRFPYSLIESKLLT